MWYFCFMIEHFPIENYEHGPLNRALGKIGLVYGSGLAEFGIQHVGMGIPLYRRKSLEDSLLYARNLLDMAASITERTQLAE
jgi:hypothetical protein